MRLTRYGHSCVRLDLPGGSLVIDPGTLSPDVDLDGVTDVLVTHEHADHLDVERLGPAVRAGLRLHTNDEFARTLRDQHGLEVHAVSPGDTLTVAGADVAVIGGRHADVVDGLPGCANVGFVLDGLYHPGDAMHVPEHKIETLLVPVAGPWTVLAHVIEFVRQVAPTRAFPIHDGVLNQVGIGMVDRWVTEKGGADYRRLTPGEPVEL